MELEDFGFFNWIISRESWLDGGFWVNFRLEDRICRIYRKGEEKPETGNWKLETGKVKSER